MKNKLLNLSFFLFMIAFFSFFSGVFGCRELEQLKKELNAGRKTPPPGENQPFPLPKNPLPMETRSIPTDDIQGLEFYFDTLNVSSKVNVSQMSLPVFRMVRLIIDTRSFRFELEYFQWDSTHDVPGQIEIKKGQMNRQEWTSFEKKLQNLKACKVAKPVPDNSCPHVVFTPSLNILLTRESLFLESSCDGWHSCDPTDFHSFMRFVEEWAQTKVNLSAYPMTDPLTEESELFETFLDPWK